MKKLFLQSFIVSLGFLSAVSVFAATYMVTPETQDRDETQQEVEKTYTRPAEEITETISIAEQINIMKDHEENIKNLIQEFNTHVGIYNDAVSGAGLSLKQSEQINCRFPVIPEVQR